MAEHVGHIDDIDGPHRAWITCDGKVVAERAVEASEVSPVDLQAWFDAEIGKHFRQAHWCSYCEQVGHTLDECTEKNVPFDPDWVVPTWVPVSEYLAENGLSPRVACGVFGRDKAGAACEALLGVLADGPVTDDLAGLLGRLTGGSKQFWSNYERNYRSGLAAGKGKYSYERLPGTPDPRAVGGYRRHGPDHQGTGVGDLGGVRPDDSGVQT